MWERGLFNKLCEEGAFINDLALTNLSLHEVRQKSELGRNK